MILAIFTFTLLSGIMGDLNMDNLYSSNKNNQAYQNKSLYIESQATATFGAEQFHLQLTAQAELE
jgi:hypothetical protein